MTPIALVMANKDYVVDNLFFADNADVMNDFDNDFEVLCNYDSNSSKEIFVTKLTKFLRRTKLFCSSLINWFLIPLISYSQFCIVDKVLLTAAKKMAYDCFLNYAAKVKIGDNRFSLGLANPNLLIV